MIKAKNGHSCLVPLYKYDASRLLVTISFVTDIMREVLQSDPAPSIAQNWPSILYDLQYLAKNLTQKFGSAAAASSIPSSC